jgi:predicted TIM-barrel fold metal-dependent hydrolase
VIIDAHSHLFPPAWQSAGRLPSQMFDLEAVFGRQEEAGVDLTVISDPHIWYGDLDLGSIERTREYNDFVAGLQRDHSGRIAGLGSVTPWRGPEHIDEAVRAVQELGLVGLALATSDRDQYLDTIPAGFWEVVGDLGVPVFVHPGGTTVGQDVMTEYRLGELCGRPLDMTLTLSRFMLWGVYERWGDVQLLCAHAGGAICAIADRLDFGHELRDYAPLGPWGEVQLEQPPSIFVKKLHLDTVTFGARGLRLALETVGSRQMHLGSDGPPLPFPISRHIDHVDELGLSAEDRAAILGGNSQTLFGL